MKFYTPDQVFSDISKTLDIYNCDLSLNNYENNEWLSFILLSEYLDEFEKIEPGFKWNFLNNDISFKQQIVSQFLYSKTFPLINFSGHEGKKFMIIRINSDKSKSIIYSSDDMFITSNFVNGGDEHSQFIQKQLDFCFKPILENLVLESEIFDISLIDFHNQFNLTMEIQLSKLMNN
jgi:hypothetical protein